MARIQSRTLVTGMLAAALAVVCVLGAQAAGSPTGVPAGSRAADPATDAATDAATGRTGGAVPRHGVEPPASGTGERVVYSVSAARVWLVDRDDHVVRSFPVTAGGVPAPAGSHRVFARRLGGLGGDGREVEHVVLFAVANAANVGFSAAADGSMKGPDPAKPTPAIRLTRADANALWQQAAVGSTVQVIG